LGYQLTHPTSDRACRGSAHCSGKWAVAKIYCRTFDGIARFVDNKVEAPILIQKIQPITSCVFIESMLAQNRDLFLAHPNRNEGRLNIEPASDDSCPMLSVPVQTPQRPWFADPSATRSSILNVSDCIYGMFRLLREHNLYFSRGLPDDARNAASRVAGDGA
jgi:hypothetical protein